MPAQKAGDYHPYLPATGLMDYAAVKGNRGVYLLRRDEGNITHYETLTFRDDDEAIKAFAGPDDEKACYYPEDSDYLLEKELLVTHYEVV